MPLKNVAFEEIEHTADWALRVYGQNLPGLLLSAAHGMNYLLGVDSAAISNHVEAHFDLDAIDAESLLVNWLSELLYWIEVEGVIFHEFTLDEVTPNRLKATVKGGPVLNLRKHIKAVTYHGLEIIGTPEGLTATIVFDV